MPIPPSLSLYIHIPWCVRKCPYCDFNSHVAAERGLPEGAYVSALMADLEQDLPNIQQRRIETVFMGGGTPSLFSPEAIHAILEGVAAGIPFAPDVEITLEANPGTVDSEKFRGFRQAGVNRLSIGVQSFNDRHLQNLGRIHNSQEAIRAAEIALKAGFENFNLDLMFGLPGQEVEEALADIRNALVLNPTHLSFYQLTLEPNTLFHKYPPSLPADESIWAMQEASQELLAAYGFHQYEVSAYSRIGYHCRHNENYWRFGDYLGIGAGAHGKLTDASGNIVRTWKIRHPMRYLETAGMPDCIGGSEVVEPGDLPVEFLINHLRLREGFAETHFSKVTGLSMNQLQPGLDRCLNDGLLERLEGVIRCTDRGWNFLDDVLEAFIARKAISRLSNYA